MYGCDTAAIFWRFVIRSNLYIAQRAVFKGIKNIQLLYLKDLAIFYLIIIHGLKTKSKNIKICKAYTVKHGYGKHAYYERTPSAN